MDSNASLCVLVGFLRPCASLLVLMGPNVSICVYMDFKVSVWVLIGP